MTDAPIKIMLEPTKQKIRVHDMEYRVFRGLTNTGIAIEMIGLFRINDPDQRAEFERAVCSIRAEDPAPITLLTKDGLISP